MSNSNDFEKTVRLGNGTPGWGPNVQPPARPEDPTTIEATNPPKPVAPTAHRETVGTEVDDRTQFHKPPVMGDRADPSKLPVGWVVVTQGPGQGASFPLFYGANRIGRGTGIEVALNFDDASISRGAHTRIAYDPKGRTFYLAPGDGTGLTYRQGQPEPILTPVPLTASTQIEVGHTVLRFVPLCGPDFDWMDIIGESKS